MNILELVVQDGVGRVEELQFPIPGRQNGEKIRIGFRPYAVQISPDLSQFQYKAVLRHTFFLGIMLRLELELPSGMILRSRMTKEEYAQLGLKDKMEVSFQIRNFRFLSSQSDPLGAEIQANYQVPPIYGEHI
jgi:hypothetical protein